MVEPNNFQNTWIAGICFIAISCLLLAINALAKTGSYSGAWPLVELVSIAVYAATCMWHMLGYARLGNEAGSTLVANSVQFILPTFVLLTAAILLALFADVYYPEVDPTMANAMVGIALTLLAVPTVFFTVGLFTIHARIGIFWSIVGTLIIPLAVFYLWTPWPPAIAMMASSFLFYRRSDQ